MTDVLIVGAGPSGLACALWCRRLGLTAQVVEAAPVAGGQLNQILYPLPDYPGYQGTGVDLRNCMLAAAREAGAEVLLQTPVTAVDVAARAVAAGGRRVAQALVLATGGSPRPLGVPGEAEMYARGEVWRGSRDAQRLQGRMVVVVGGGDRAVENALMLDEQGVRVTLVHRRERFRAQDRFVQELRRRPGITVRLEAAVAAILGEHRVEGVLLQQAGQETLVPADAVLAYVGLRPNAGLVQGQLALTADGRIQTDGEGRTSSPGVYAIGDVAIQPAYSSISTCVGQAMVVAKQIALAGAGGA